MATSLEVLVVFTSGRLLHTSRLPNRIFPAEGFLSSRRKERLAHKQNDQRKVSSTFESPGTRKLGHVTWNVKTGRDQLRVDSKLCTLMLFPTDRWHPDVISDLPPATFPPLEAPSSLSKLWWTCLEGKGGIYLRGRVSCSKSVVNHSPWVTGRDTVKAYHRVHQLSKVVG